MAKSILSVLTWTLAITVSFGGRSAIAQEPDSVFIVVFDYMKSSSGDYVDMEREVWKPIHQERIKRGRVSSWALWSVDFGVDRSYDYVTVNVYRTWESYENGYADFAEILEAAHPGADLDEIGERASNAREVVKSEMWELSSWLGQGGNSLMTVAYMKAPVGGGGDYMELETEVWRPMHEKVMEAGGVEAWGVLSLWFPGGTDYPYGYAAVNQYKSMSQMAGRGLTPEIVEAVHPGKSWQDIVEMTNKARKMVRVDLWRLVDRTAAED